MPLQLSPSSFEALNTLITQYNLVPSGDDIQRLFYLQKINKELNKTELDKELFEWLNDSTEQGWHAQLHLYGIHPDASFFLKNIQFSQAAAKHSVKTTNKPTFTNEYDLLQQRDILLDKASFEEVRESYCAVCIELNKLSRQKDTIYHKVKHQLKILESAKAKFDAIRMSQSEGNAATVHYDTQELGKNTNNFNFKFTMSGYEHPFVFRVEDRDNLGLEQHLYSYPVSKHFAEDFGVFMWGFINKEKQIEYKPVVLCQYAKQGDLTEVAKSLRGTNSKHFSAITSHYFNQLTNLCTELLKSKTYHPDIKLSNFLIHENRLIISDRKTLVSAENSKASEMRSSLRYAPKEYNDCVTKFGTLNFKAYTTTFNLPQFMAYQLGMALKEFLILTQQDDIDFDEFRETNHSAREYFTNPDRSIINLFALINELTREDASKRMTIQQMQKLLTFRNHPTPIFYEELEKVLPAKTLGIQQDVDEINALLQSKVNDLDLLKKANLIFSKLSKIDSPEPRLLYMAEQLATKCFKDVSYNYFANLSKSIETKLLEKDWNIAPWYRKIAHVLSFGYFRVARRSNVNSIKIDLDLRGEEFQMHFAQLEYISTTEFKALGKTESANFTHYIFNNLENIRVKEAMPAEVKKKVIRVKEEPEETSVTELDADFSTVVITHSSEVKKQGEMPSVNEQDKQFEEDPDFSTVVITRDPDVIKAEENPLVIDPDKKAEVEVKKEVQKLDMAENDLHFFAKNRKRKFQTYRSTMKLGDHLTAAAVFEPPIPTVNM